MILAAEILIDVALLALRMVVGTSFALSGWFKLTASERRRRMEQSLAEAKMPRPRQLAPLVAAGELVGGMSLVLGLMAPLGAGLLLAITAVAFLTVVVPSEKARGVERVENLLYTPEALFLVTTFLLTTTGAGRLSLDALLW
jgi:putative oxidoreductase